MTPIEQYQQRVTEARELLQKAEADLARAAKAEKDSPAALFYPQEEDRAYWIKSTPSNRDVNAFGVDGTLRADNGWQQPAFRTREHAEAMCHALNVSLLLRAQPGVVEADEDADQWFITFCKNGLNYGIVHFKALPLDIVCPPIPTASLGFVDYNDSSIHSGTTAGISY